MKLFYWQTLGTRKYYVSFHDGISKHKDGSDFYGMRIFKNKKVMNKFLNDLKTEGYREKDWINLG